MGKSNAKLFKGHAATVSIVRVIGVERVRVRYKVANGLIKRKHFPLAELKAANNFAAQIERATQLDGTSWTPQEKTAMRFWRDFTNAERAAGRNVPTLLAVMQAAVNTLAQQRSSAAFSAFVRTYVDEAAQRLKPARLALVRRTLERYAETLPAHDMPLAQIGEDAVRNATALIVPPGAALSTRRHYLSILSACFARAQERELCRTNPAALVLRTLATPAADTPTFLQVDEVQALLHAAAQHPDKGAALHFVIGLLTGIRMAERARLQWRDLRLDEPRPYINLPATKAKTGRARQVYLYGSHAAIIKAMMPARYNPTALILSGHTNEKAGKEAAILLQNRFAERAGVQLPRNVLRHTAASYLCAYLESMSAAALNMGHSETMLARHYRALVTKAEAERFFSLPVPAVLQGYGTTKEKSRRTLKRKA